MCEWGYALYGACWGNNIEIVELLIKKGATDFAGAFHDACKGGNLEIAKLLIKHRSSFRKSTWNYGLKYACEYGNVDIVKLILKEDVDEIFRGFQLACYNGHLEVVKIMMEEVIRRYPDDINGIFESCYDIGLDYACKANKIEIAKFMIEQGVNIDKCLLSLTEDDIIHFVHKNVKYFGNYTHISDMYIKWKSIVIKQINKVLYKDLISVISLYI